jgi:hypothetical protein
MQRVKDLFSATMDACYPIIERDIGSEKLRTMISGAFSDLLREHGTFLHRYGVLDVLPEGIELPGVYLPPAPGSYLIEGRTPDKAFEMFCEMVRYGFPGLCISATHPRDVVRKYGIPEGATVMWLSGMGVENALPPTNLGAIRDWISDFISQNENAVILLDGIEYLTSMNGFDLTYRFLHDIREEVALKVARFLVPLVPATLEPKQLELLERYMRVVKA